MPRSNIHPLPSLTLAIALAVPVLGGATLAHAKSVVVRQSLDATGVDADARGSAIFKVRGRGSRQSGSLVVRVAGLPAATSFDVTVAGVRIGSLDTSRRGKGHARFHTRPRGDDQLLGVDPRGRSLAVVDPAAGALLGAGIPSRGIDPGDVRCCLPDDSGPECEDRTAAECAAEGGTNMGPGSCLPDPCGTGSGGPTPGGDVVCCIPDDSGPECEDRTLSECAAEGGVAVAGTSCTPNPCAGTSVTTTTVSGGGPSTSTTLAGTPSVSVTCERREGRSRISVNGNALVPGTYAARVHSGANEAAAPARATVGDEIEFDFDSAPDDIAAGATAIAATFIQGTPPQVTGTIVTAQDAVVVEATVTCAEQ